MRLVGDFDTMEDNNTLPPTIPKKSQGRDPTLFEIFVSYIRWNVYYCIAKITGGELPRRGPFEMHGDVILVKAQDRKQS